MECAKTVQMEEPTGKETKGNEKKYVGVGVAVGICVGIAIGAATDDMGVWLALGISVGAAIGAAKDAGRL